VDTDLLQVQKSIAPECGIKLQAGSSGKDDNASSTGITNTKGDVYGAGFTGSVILPVKK
jgi:hypothetical protein